MLIFYGYENNVYKKRIAYLCDQLLYGQMRTALRVVVPFLNHNENSGYGKTWKKKRRD